MKKRTIKKVSVLGLILMGASAVTAAILPNKADADMNQLDVTLTQRDTLDGGNVYTCKFTVNVGANDCNLTAGTLSTIEDGTSALENGFQTGNNTTTVPA